MDKAFDVVRLYLNPPEGAVVLSVDEKSQVQALARSQPAFPMMPGMPEHRTHDYVRHGVTSLFAAFNTADGTVITSLHRRHRTIELKKFLAKINDQVPDDLQVHLVCDNYGTHKSPAIKTWLQAHPRFHMHYTPTYSSWLNQVERWFAYLTEDLLRRGDHRSVPSPRTRHPCQDTPRILVAHDDYRRILRDHQVPSGPHRPDLVLDHRPARGPSALAVVEVKYRREASDAARAAVLNAMAYRDAYRSCPTPTTYVGLFWGGGLRARAVGSVWLCSLDHWPAALRLVLAGAK